MSRRQVNPLRSLSEEELTQLQRLARSPAQPAAGVARAKALLAVAQGSNYTEAARAAGRKSGDAVAHLVARFNAEGMRAVSPRHGGGAPRRYGPVERETILAEARRTPDREQDGTAAWSLSTLQRALRQKGGEGNGGQGDKAGLSQISTYTIWLTLKEAGLGWQKSRTWCDTGTSWRVRRRKSGDVVELVTDPDAEAKKT